MDFDQAAAIADRHERMREEEKRRKEEEEARKKEFRVLSDDNVLLQGLGEINTTKGPVPFVLTHARRNDDGVVSVGYSFCDGEYIVEAIVTRAGTTYRCTEIDHDYRTYQTMSLKVVAERALTISLDRAAAMLAARAW